MVDLDKVMISNKTQKNDVSGNLRFDSAATSNLINNKSEQQEKGMESEQPDEYVKVYFNGEELEIDDIHVMSTSAINEHVSVTVTGMVRADIYDTYVQSATSAIQVTVKHTIKGATSYLYEGLLTRIRAKAEGAGAENSVYFIKIESLSYTCLLDIQKKHRSFQDIQMMFDALIQEVLADYDGADYINNAADGEAIAVFTLQYSDTDWEFLKRQVSKFEQALFPDATLPAPKIQFGTPKGVDRGELDQYDYTISKNLMKYLEYAQNQYEHEISEFDFMEYEIFDEYALETFMLGDKVTYQESSLRICHIVSEIKDNKLYNTYSLATEDGLKMPRLANGDIQGLSIPGKVLDVQDNRIKLHLEIDEEQDKETAYWFDYATFYATWYGMPEINDYVNLHFPTVDERTAIGLNSFKQNPSGGYTRNNQPQTPPNGSAAGMPGPIDFEAFATDPAVKMLVTKAGRKIALGPDSVTVEFSEDTYLVLHDTEGIVLYTTQDISMYAAKSIYATAGEDIYLTAEEKIVLENESSLLEVLPGSIRVRSNDTKMN